MGWPGTQGGRGSRCICWVGADRGVQLKEKAGWACYFGQEAFARSKTRCRR